MRENTQVTYIPSEWFLNNLGFSPLPISVTVERRESERLSRTCFRGGKPLSGNFKFWPNMHALMLDLHMCRAIATEVTAAVQKCMNEEQNGCNLRCTVQHPDLIGWQRTLPASEVSPEYLERYTITGRTDGLRIKRSFGLLAPPTNLVTLALRCHKNKRAPGTWRVQVNTLYPGVDIGKLEPDTKDNRLINPVVFFDWDHPGEPIPQTCLTTHQR